MKLLQIPGWGPSFLCQLSLPGAMAAAGGKPGAGNGQGSSGLARRRDPPLMSMVYMYMYIHVCMHVCMYACLHVCMYVCMHACMHACMHVYMYTCKGIFIAPCVCHVSLSIYLSIYLPTCLPLHTHGARRGPLPKLTFFLLRQV